MADQAHRVATACASCYVHGKPCNVFTQDVARSLKISLPGAAASGKADDMIAALRVHWRKLSRHEAIINAGRGDFIIAALASPEFAPRPIMNLIRSVRG